MFPTRGAYPFIILWEILTVAHVSKVLVLVFGISYWWVYFCGGTGKLVSVYIGGAIWDTINEIHGQCRSFYVISKLGRLKSQDNPHNCRSYFKMYRF